VATYLVVAPCAYVDNKGAHVHSKPGAVVDLDDDTAALLGAAVKLQGGQPKPKRRREPAPDVEAAADGE